jgi:hypothetical protein
MTAPELPMDLFIHIEPDANDQPVWWAESPQLPGFSAAAPSLRTLREQVWDALFKEHLQ